MSEANMRPIGHINLFNAGLMPKKKSFTARSVTLWGAVVLVTMIGVAWWAVVEKENVARQVAEQTARQAAEAARGGDAPTLQQISNLEQVVHTKEAALGARRAQRDALKRGVAMDGGGPSATLRLIATSIPNDVWITELSARGDKLEVVGRTINPAALAGWMMRLGELPFFAAKPISAMHLDNTAFIQGAAGAATSQAATRASVYSFNLTAVLAQPLADDGGRAP